MRNVYFEVTYGKSSDTRTFSIFPDENSEGLLVGPLLFSTSVRTWVQRERTSSGLKDVKVSNRSGELDSFADEEFVSCAIKEVIDGVATTKATAEIERVVIDGKKTITFKLKDALKKLEKPIQDDFYPASETSITGSGTNTFYSLEGLPRPLCIGRNSYSVLPVLVNGATDEYHVHDEDVFQVGTVYNNGLSVGFTHHNKGFVLSVSPATGSVITADVKGQENVANTNRIFTFPDVIDYLLDIRESISYSTSDATAIDSAKGYDYHYYQDANTNRTISEVLKILTDSHTGWFYADKDGDIRFGYLKEPEVSADVDVSQYDIIGGLEIFDDLAPNLTSKVGGNKNWHVLQPENIAAAVTDQRKKEITASHQTVKDGANTIDEFYIDTAQVADFVNIGTDAQAEADSITSLYSQKRKFYTFTSSLEADIGDTVGLTYPRFGLDSGVNLLCVGKEIDFIKNTYKITLWG